MRAPVRLEGRVKAAFESRSAMFRDGRRCLLRRRDGCAFRLRLRLTPEREPCSWESRQSREPYLPRFYLHKSAFFDEGRLTLDTHLSPVKGSKVGRSAVAAVQILTTLRAGSQLQVATFASEH